MSLVLAGIDCLLPLETPDAGFKIVQPPAAPVRGICRDCHQLSLPAYLVVILPSEVHGIAFVSQGLKKLAGVFLL
jgi:hypothetical protein